MDNPRLNGIMSMSSGSNPHSFRILRKKIKMTVMAYQAAKRTFGVELEGTNLSVSEAREAFSANPALSGWRIVSDGTAGVTFEAVSPVLKQDDNGFRSVREACDTLNDAGAEVSVKCGLHVHIGVSDFTAKELAGVVNRYNYHSQGLDLLVAPSRRRNSNHFCRDHDSKLDAGNLTARQLAGSQNTRYRKMNLRSFLAHGTIENRHHQGTLNSSKVINWVKLVAIQVEIARSQAAEQNETVPASPAIQGINLRGNMERIARHLRENGPTGTEVLMRELGLTKNVLQSTMTRMRRKGIPLRFQGGAYRISHPVTAVAATTPSGHRGLWEDVPQELAVYYTRRMTALRTTSDGTTNRTQFA